MSRIFWDTNLFIYLLEGHGQHADRVAALRQRMLERGDELYTSALTLGEILVKSLEAGDEERASHYQRSIAAVAVVLPFGTEVAASYARIRQDRSIRAPDAVQLACASGAAIDLFITNDDRLSRKSVPGIQFVTSLERAFV
jgi:predicted nucleic acid-binding protein